MRFEFGEFCYDTNQMQLFRQGNAVHLTPKAMALLELLLNNRPAVVRHEQLFDTLWPDVVVQHANLKNLIADLRHALDDHRRQGRFIRAVHGRGYAFTGRVRELRNERPGVQSAAVLTAGPVASFYASGVTESHFAPRGMAQEMLQAGQAIDAVTADNDLAVVVDSYGIMSPILLYFAHLKGWSFDPGDLSTLDDPNALEEVKRALQRGPDVGS